MRQQQPAYEQALRLDPSLTAIHYNLGYARLNQGLLDEAIAHLRYATERLPTHADSHLSLGVALLRKNEIDPAIAVYRSALERFPNYAPLWNNLGNARKAKEDFDGSVRAYREALRCSPADALALNNLADALLNLGLAGDAAACFRRSLDENPDLAEAHSNLIFAMGLDPSYGLEAIAAECRRWWRHHGEPLRVKDVSFSNTRIPNRPLRVGYVSPDFREHPLGRHILPAIRMHDRTQFEIVCYADVEQPDEMTAQFRSSPVRWHDSGSWTDSQLAGQVRRDEIDILVDLSLHSAGNRLRAFARQPAPVQVSFAGYPGSTGVETIGYRLTDRFLDPPGVLNPFPDEPVRLPDSFWCFSPTEQPPPVNDLPAKETGVVTFGCLSKFTKVNPLVMGWWCEILRRVPNSRFMLLCPAGSARARVAAAFEACGITQARIEFADRQLRPAYLAAYHRIEIALDPFPYNGHMTTCDALWMGVPVVSLAGGTHVSRGGLSMLSHIGLPELAATTPECYVQIAVDLANDLPRLAALRGGLRERMQSSPLMDAARFTRGLEAAYRAIWRRWCMGENPAPASEGAP